MTVLTKSDKLQIIESRVRTLEYKQYSLDVDAIVENAKATPDQDALLVINTAIEEIGDQIGALNSELAAVNLLTE
jgi:hypothetical protein